MTRLLVIVLTLVGPMPFRVCTCAAAPTVCRDPGCPVAPKVKSCSCGHHHEAAAEVESDEAGTGGGAATHAHPPEHKSSCPAVQARPVADAAVPSDARDADPELPAECLATAADPFFAPGRPAGATVPERRRPPRPLFITLLTLRN